MLERCRSLSPYFVQLILLGERYGSYILPPQVPAALIERLLLHLLPEERTRFDVAYQLDENAVPPEYVLLRVQGLERASRIQQLIAAILARLPEQRLEYYTVP